MARPRLLDLFCGAGGAAVGYHRAGFEVVGVDIKPQKHYPFKFIQMDVRDLAFHLDYYQLNNFKAVHASPPCQAFTDLKSMHNSKKHDDYLTPTRKLLKIIRLPYVIENVPGAPMRASLMLCGTMFGLSTKDAELRRHRYFETTFHVPLTPSCSHRLPTIGVYGGGHGASLHRHQKGQRCFTVKEEREAMGIDWMTVDELSQAIPPAYCEFIGKQLMEHLNDSDQQRSHP